jgi:hypothetical protein
VSKVAAVKEKRRCDGEAMTGGDEYLERFKVCKDGWEAEVCFRRSLGTRDFYVKAYTGGMLSQDAAATFRACEETESPNGAV